MGNQIIIGFSILYKPLLWPYNVPVFHFGVPFARPKQVPSPAQAWPKKGEKSHSKSIHKREKHAEPWTTENNDAHIAKEAHAFDGFGACFGTSGSANFYATGPGGKAKAKAKAR